MIEQHVGHHYTQTYTTNVYTLLMDCSLVISNYMCILRFYMFIARIFVISSPDCFFIGSWEWTIYCYIRHGNHYCDILGNKMGEKNK
jgi:hypothetical protein